MLKAATLLLSFLMGRMNSSGSGSFLSPQELIDHASDKITDKLRGLMKQFALGACGAVLLMAGFLVAYFHVLDQWDVTDVVVIDAVFAGGIVMAVIGLILLLTALMSPKNSRVEAQQVAQEEMQRERARHSLEEAISAFIYDHIKEREFQREQRRAEHKDEHQDEHQDEPFSRSREASGKNENSGSPFH